MEIRQSSWNYAKTTTFDVAIIGGGINGSCLYNKLCNKGYKVILIDKGDFGCGTSQASAMMIWGGLLYLRNFDIFSVYHFSKERDAMIKDMGAWVTPCSFRYIPVSKGGIKKHFVHLCLYLYWLLGDRKSVV